MVYKLVDIPAYNIGNISIPAYKKVIRDDGSYYLLGWKTIEPYVLEASGCMSYYAPYDSRSQTVIANTDNRSVTWVTWANTISGAQTMTILYKNDMQLVPFGTHLLSWRWRDGGHVIITSSMGDHYVNSGGGGATREWNGNIFTQLEPRLTDRRFMLETYGEGAYYHVSAARGDVHNDDYIERNMAVSLQQYLEPEQFYNIYGVRPIE